MNFLACFIARIRHYFYIEYSGHMLLHVSTEIWEKDSVAELPLFFSPNEPSSRSQTAEKIQVLRGFCIIPSFFFFFSIDKPSSVSTSAACVEHILACETQKLKANFEFLYIYFYNCTLREHYFISVTMVVVQIQ